MNLYEYHLFSVFLCFYLFISEILLVSLFVPADRAAQRKFLSILRMLNFEDACIWACTLRQLTPLIPGHVVPIILLGVTGVTEVRVPPAEPLRNVAAELALELNIVTAMLHTVLYTSTYNEGGTLTTDQLFWLKAPFLPLGFFISLVTVLHTTKVRFLALKAFIIGQFRLCVRLKVVVKRVPYFFETVMLVNSLMLSSLQGLFLQVSFTCLNFNKLFRQLMTVGSSNSSFALRTVQEVEINSGSRPTSFND